MTYTVKTGVPSIDIVTGTYITANKPINAIGGNMCVYHYPSSSFFSSVVTNFLPVEHYGLTNVSPAIGEGGYTVNIVANEEDTEVSFEETKMS